MQTEGKFWKGTRIVHRRTSKTAHRVFSMFHCPEDDFSTHLVTCLQSLSADLENIWAAHFKLLASICRLSTQLYINSVI